MRLVEFMRSGRVRLRRGGAALLLLTLTPATAWAADVNGDAAQPVEPMSLPAAEAVATAPADAAPSEPDSPFYKLDWSLALRGAYINDSSTGARYQALTLPLSLIHI